MELKMGLFRCSHEVYRKDMEAIQIEKGDYLYGILDNVVGAVIKYKGFCHKCKAYVTLEETIASRPLFELFERGYTFKKDEK